MPYEWAYPGNQCVFVVDSIPIEDVIAARVAGISIPVFMQIYTIAEVVERPCKIHGKHIGLILQEMKTRNAAYAIEGFRPLEKISDEESSKTKQKIDA